MALTNFKQINGGKQLLEDIAAIKDDIAKAKVKLMHDSFTVPSDGSTKEFTLTKSPVGEIQFFMNGIRYDSPDITYDSTKNSVSWTSNEDIDIANANIVITYFASGAEIITESQIEFMTDSEIDNMFAQSKE